MATNPFTTIKAAIKTYLGNHWDSLAADNPAKIKIGNRFTHKRMPVQPGDLPEVDVRALEGGETKPFASSSTGLFTRNYQFGITTDQADISDALEQSEWEFVRAAAKMQKELLGLPGTVLRVGISFERETDIDPEMNRGRRRWTGIVVVAVTFQVPISQITP